MSDKYCTETQAAAIMGMSVEDFKRIVSRDSRAVQGFGMPGTDEPHFVTALVQNYKIAFEKRSSGR